MASAFIFRALSRSSSRNSSASLRFSSRPSAPARNSKLLPSLTAPSSPPSPFLKTASSFSSAAAANAAYAEIYNRQRQQMVLNHQVPDVAIDAYVAPNAVLIGGVTVDDRASVWYSAVLRADLNTIHVGAYSNIGDRVVVHAVAAAPTGLSAETEIGRYVTVGAGSTLKSCIVEDECVIGQKCVLLEGSLMEKNSVLADASVLPAGCYVPSGELWAGNPAQFVRKLTGDEVAEISKLAEAVYVASADHAAEFLPYSTAYIEAEKLKKALAAKA